MNGIKKKIIICIICVSLLLLAVNLKNKIVDYISAWKPNDIFVELKKNKDAGIHEKQRHQVDSYTITLENYKYKKSTSKYYLLFSVKNEEGDVEAKLYPDNQLINFGKDDRFDIMAFITGGQTIHAKYDESVLYIYYEFSCTYSEEADTAKVTLTDYSHPLKEEDEPDYMEYYFDLKTN